MINCTWDLSQLQECRVSFQLTVNKKRITKKPLTRSHQSWPRGEIRSKDRLLRLRIVSSFLRHHRLSLLPKSLVNFNKYRPLRERTSNEEDKKYKNSFWNQPLVELSFNWSSLSRTLKTKTNSVDLMPAPTSWVLAIIRAYTLYGFCAVKCWEIPGTFEVSRPS